MFAEHSANITTGTRKEKGEMFLIEGEGEMFLMITLYNINIGHRNETRRTDSA